ncbi:hypothetical protein ACQ3JU_0400 (plasmid) [Bradyrhizobium guangxiense]
MNSSQRRVRLPQRLLCPAPESDLSDGAQVAMVGLARAPRRSEAFKPRSRTAPGLFAVLEPIHFDGGAGHRSADSRW